VLLLLLLLNVEFDLLIQKICILYSDNVLIICTHLLSLRATIKSLLCNCHIFGLFVLSKEYLQYYYL